LILLGRDRPENKADLIFNLYDNQKLGYITVSQFRELVDHLYFLVLYAIPAMIVKRNRESDTALLNYLTQGAFGNGNIHKQIQYLR
jgi:Ca2+-binding EF-hand superfamily protein